MWLLRCNHYLKHVTNTKYLQLLESPTSVTNIDVALVMGYLCQELLFDATFQKWIQGRLSKWAFRHFKLKSYFGFEFEISAGLITQLGHSWVCYEVYTFLKSVYTSKKSFDGKLICVRSRGCKIIPIHIIMYRVGENR